MRWLRYVRIFFQSAMVAGEVAERLLGEKPAQRRFMKEWAKRSAELMNAVLEEMQDQLDDMEEDTTAIEQGPQESSRKLGG